MIENLFGERNDRLRVRSAMYRCTNFGGIRPERYLRRKARQREPAASGTSSNCGIPVSNEMQALWQSHATYLTCCREIERVN